MLNHILCALSDGDRGALLAGAEVVELRAREEIEKPREEVNYAYFIEAGVAAVLLASGEERIALGLIGNEGSSGIAVFLGNTQSPYLTLMLTEGRAHRVRADRVTTAMDERPELRRLLLRYCLAFYNQAAHTAMSNAASTVEQRVARWVLMMGDRLPLKPATMTHDLIAYMLDTRRAGVTEALGALQSQGLIQVGRKAVTILDRTRIEEIAGHFYGLPEKEFVRLIGTYWPPITKTS